MPRAPKPIDYDLRVVIEPDGTHKWEERTPPPPVKGYVHPKTIVEFEGAYRSEYEQQLESCDRWIEWCKKQNDYYGVNFHQGMRSAHVFNDIKMHQLLRILKREAPNA